MTNLHITKQKTVWFSPLQAILSKTRLDNELGNIPKKAWNALNYYYKSRYTTNKVAISWQINY